MNLNNLQAAWRQFQVANSLQQMNHHDVLSMLESYPDKSGSRVKILLFHSVLFIVLTIICQGG